MRSACIVSSCARADGDDTDGRVVAAEDPAIESVGACPGERGRQPLLDHAALQFGAVGRESQRGIEVQSVRRQREIRDDEGARRGNDERGGLLDGFGGGLHRDPEAAEARQRNAGEAEIEDVLAPRRDSAPE